jgi:hypothetical protein
MSVTHPEIPKRPKYTRAELMFGGFRFHPLSSVKCQGTHFDITKISFVIVH